MEIQLGILENSIIVFKVKVEKLILIDSFIASNKNCTVVNSDKNSIYEGGLTCCKNIYCGDVWAILISQNKINRSLYNSAVTFVVYLLKSFYGDCQQIDNEKAVT